MREEQNEEILATLKEMKSDIDNELLKIDQESNRRLLAIEVQMDKLEAHYKILVQMFVEKEKNKAPMTAAEILEEIDSMSNDERWKLFEELFYKYFNKNNLPRTEIDF